MYRVTVRLSPHRTTVPRSISSTAAGRRNATPFRNGAGTPPASLTVAVQVRLCQGAATEVSDECDLLDHETLDATGVRDRVGVRVAILLAVDGVEGGLGGKPLLCDPVPLALLFRLGGELVVG